LNLLNLAWKNIWHKPLQLLLSLVLFGLGIGLINFLILLNHQLKEKFEKNLAGIDMVIGAKGSPLQMILCSMYHIDAPTGNIQISEAKPFLNPKHPLIAEATPLSLGDSHKGFRIVGTTKSFLDLYEGKVGEGAIWSHDFEVVIGKAVANQTGLKIGDKFQSAHGFNDDPDMLHEDVQAFKVVGILAPNGSVLDQLILTSSPTVWYVHDHEGEGHEDHAGHEDNDQANHDAAEVNLLDHPDKEITSILIKFKNRTNFQALNMPRNINENTDLQAASPAIEINRLYSMIGVGVDAIRNLAFIIAIVSAFSIFISLFSSLKDRKYELALMRVSGASPSYLFILILLEGLILAFLGFVFGMILSHVAMELFANFAQESYRYSLTGWLFLKSEWLILLTALGLGALAAIIPAISAYRTDIHQTLSKI